MLVAALSLAMLAAGGTPVASAQTTVAPPEVPPPPGSTPFSDNPAIVDPHPMPVQSWSRVPDDRAVSVHFATGTPQCFGAHATTVETADSVTVELRGGTVPEAVGRACILIGLTGTLQVPLQAPLGACRVLSVY